MDYLDFEICIGAGEGRLYPLSVVRSPAGEQRATLQLPFDELELKNRLQTLQIALLKSGSTRRNVAPPAEHTSVEEFGRTLFAALLPDEIRSGYRLSRQQAQQEGKGLRLRLRIEAPDLAALPWEFLYDDAEGDFVCLSTDTPIVRYLELDRPPAPVTIEPPLRVLGMIASPSDRAGLDVTREKQRMREALADLEARGLVALTWLEGQTWRDLQRAMRPGHGPWHAFHFVGHGGFDATSGEGLLALADDDGRSFHLPATQLGRLLDSHHGLRLAVLNACEGAQGNDTDIFSSTAAVLVRRGIPAVVAMQYEITDRAAIEFSHTFYESLAEGLPVDAAVAEARKAISVSVTNSVEWGTPVLHMRAPDGRLFDVDPTAGGDGVTSEAPPPTVPPLDASPAPHTAKPAARATSSLQGARPIVLWAGAAVVLVSVALAAWLLFFRGGDAPGNARAAAGPIASIALIADLDEVPQGSETTIRAAVLDSTGAPVATEALQGVALRWWTGDSSIAMLASGADPLTATLRGLRPGTTELCVGFADTTRFPSRVAGKGVISVLPDGGRQAEAFQAHLAAMRAFDDADQTDAEVLAQYRTLLTTHRGNLQDLAPDEIETIEARVAELEALSARYDAVARRAQSDTMTLGQARTQWAGFLAMADSIRKSPAKTHARAAADSLQRLLTEEASLVDFTLCTTSGRDCPERNRTQTFATGQRIYFILKVKQPQGGSVSWRFLGPGGIELDRGSNSLPASSSGYRLSQSVGGPTAPGRYELRVYNALGGLIGRRVVTIR